MARRLKHAAYAFKATPRQAVERCCPICNYKGPMEPFGYPVRPEARCPGCRSLERHRGICLWLRANEATIRDKRILHFAPEPPVTRMIAPLASEYTTADIVPGRVDLTLNIEDIDQPDHRYDVVVCSHVLEHVDDAKALAEIRRILVPGGLAIMLVPVVHHWPSTFELPDVASDEERFRLYGQRDHVRRYGSDFVERLAKVFEVEIWQPTPMECLEYGLGFGEKIYLCSSTQ